MNKLRTAGSMNPQEDTVDAEETLRAGLRGACCVSATGWEWGEKGEGWGGVAPVRPQVWSALRLPRRVAVVAAAVEAPPARKEARRRLGRAPAARPVQARPAAARRVPRRPPRRRPVAVVGPAAGASVEEEGPGGRRALAHVPVAPARAARVEPARAVARGRDGVPPAVPRAAAARDAPAHASRPQTAAALVHSCGLRRASPRPEALPAPDYTESPPRTHSVRVYHPPRTNPEPSPPRTHRHGRCTRPGHWVRVLHPPRSDLSTRESSSPRTHLARGFTRTGALPAPDPHDTDGAPAPDHPNTDTLLLRSGSSHRPVHSSPGVPPSPLLHSSLPCPGPLSPHPGINHRAPHTRLLMGPSTPLSEHLYSATATDTSPPPRSRYPPQTQTCML